MGQQTRTHRERSQPHSRSKYGLLEKKKDYKLRAKNFHEKEDAIKNLEIKSSTRNPDEFYFRMTSILKSSKGKLLTEDHTLSPDMIKLMKTQDRSYITLMIQKEISQIEKLKKKINVPFRGKRLLFTENGCTEVETQIQTQQTDAEKELELRENRLTDLQHVLSKMSLEYQLTHSKGSKSKIESDDGTVVYKWRNERSK